jgi:signal transduction histidine kinase
METKGSLEGEGTRTQFRRFGEGLFPQDATEQRRLPSGTESQRLEAVGRLAAGVAHDFNNLLLVILTCSEELENGVSEDEHRERAGEIRSAAERGAKLTRQILRYARDDYQERIPVDVNRAVLDTTRLLLRTLGDHVRLRSEPAAGLPQVLLGAGHLEQILINLAANARDAMPEGGTVSIGTRLAAIEDGDSVLGIGWHLLITVTDEGVGMTEEELRRASEPFFTTKASEGTGLGLATVLEIARGAGGDVRFESVPGRGTTVSVYLPAVDVEGRPLTMPRRDLDASAGH